MRLLPLSAALVCVLTLSFFPGTVGARPFPQQPNCINLIANGNFEEEGSWEFGRTPKPAYFSSEKSHEGNRSAFLGNLNPNDDEFSFSSIWQGVEVPPEATEVTLNFWYLAVSQDAEGFDEQKVVLINPEDNSIISVPWKHSGGTPDWESVTLNLVEILRGRRAKIYFGVVNDGDGKPTAMYLDEVSLMVCLPPTPTPLPPTPSPTFTSPPPTEGAEVETLAVSETPEPTPTPVPTPTPTPTPVNLWGKFIGMMGGITVPILGITLIGLIIGVGIASFMQKRSRRRQK